MTIFVTMFAQWATLVWAARSILAESFLNFSWVILMGILLTEAFILICGTFRSMRMEFDSLLFFMETLLFATIPLIASTIITWFVSVEMPSVGLTTCFTVSYFAYMAVLARPREASYPIPYEVLRDSAKRHTCFVLPLHIVLVMYAIPVVASPLLYIITAHNEFVSLSSVFARVTDIGMVILFPVALALNCLEYQAEYIPIKIRMEIQQYMSTLTLVTSVLLFICFQEHPVFDHWKEAFGDGSGSSLWVSTVACACAALVALSVYVHRRVEGRDEESDMTITPSEREITKIFVNACSGLIGGLLWYLLQLPAMTIVVMIGAAVALADFYQRSWINVPISMQLTGLLQVIFGSATAAVVAMFLSIKFLFVMSYTFKWHADITIRHFCILFSMVVAGAVLIPTLAYGSQKVTKSDGLLGDILPGGLSSAYSSAASGVITLWGTTSRNLFGISFPCLVYFLCGMELLVREQDWAALGGSAEVDAEDVYPTSLFAGSAVLVGYTALHLYINEVIPAWTAWSVIVTEMCKLLHYAGVPSLGIGAALSLMSSYTFPFAFHCFDNASTSAASVSGTSSSSNGAGHITSPISGEYNPLTGVESAQIGAQRQVMNPLLFIGYCLWTASATIWARYHIAEAALQVVMLHHTTALQQSAACLSLWCADTALMLLAFMPSASSIRSLMMLVSVVGALIATDALGPFSLTYDPTSPYVLVLGLNPEMTSDHTIFFMLTSVILAGGAALQLIPIGNPLHRLGFAVVFSYCASRALVGGCFPLTGSIDSPGHGYLELPSIFSFSIALLGTSSALHASVSSASSYGAWVFVACNSVPLIGLLWVSLVDTLREHGSGIVWAAAIVNACVGVCTRLSEMFRDLGARSVGGSEGEKHKHNGKVSNAFAASVCVVAAVMGIVWSSIGTLGNPHFNAMYMIPFSTLLLLCTRTGAIIEHVHPLALSLLVSSIWWILSAVYELFVKGYGEDPGRYFQSNYGLFQDENVSVWTGPSIWLTIINLVLAVLPIPAIQAGVMRRQGSSEEMLFVLGILSVISIIGAQTTSVRLLGCAGAVLGFWRCYDLGVRVGQSNRVL